MYLFMHSKYSDEKWQNWQFPLRELAKEVTMTLALTQDGK